MRTTATEVQEILDNSQLDDTIVDAFIKGANTLVTKVLGTSNLGTDLLSEIERWLTAHMISVTRERTAKKEEAGGAKIEYTGSWGQNLSSTGYGQMVLSLDTTGAMAGLAGKSVKITAIKS